MIHFHDSLTDGQQELELRSVLEIDGVAHPVYYKPGFGAQAMVYDLAPGTGEQTDLLAGYPLTLEQSHRLARALLGAAAVRTVLPPHVLTADGLRLAWWTPAQRRRIWFSPQDQPGLQHISRREVLHPALLWVAEANRLYLYALATSERPEAHTPIYQAPYLNTYPDGWVCAGEAAWPRSAAPESIPDWERVMLDSEGTKVWAPQLTRYPGGHHALWEAMLTATEFPVSSLVPTGQTVLDALNYTWPAFYADAPPQETIQR